MFPSSTRSLWSRLTPCREKRPQTKLNPTFLLSKQISSMERNKLGNKSSLFYFQFLRTTQFLGNSHGDTATHKYRVQTDRQKKTQNTNTERQVHTVIDTDTHSHTFTQTHRYRYTDRHTHTLSYNKFSDDNIVFFFLWKI